MHVKCEWGGESTLHDIRDVNVITMLSIFISYNSITWKLSPHGIGNDYYCFFWWERGGRLSDVDWEGVEGGFGAGE